MGDYFWVIAIAEDEGGETHSWALVGVMLTKDSGCLGGGVRRGVAGRLTVYRKRDVAGKVESEAEGRDDGWC